MKNKYDKVLWIFSHPNPIEIPSYVVNGIKPANFLGIKKIIFLENHDPEKTLSTFNPSVIIISKVFHNNVLNLINYAKSKKIKIISFFADWSFDPQSKTDNTNLNLPIAIKSDFIAVHTKACAEVLYQNTKLKSFVIPDTLRFESHNIISRISYPFEVCWFGMNSNHDSLINELKNIDAINLKVNLRIITIFIDELKLKIQALKLTNINIQYVEWYKDANKEIVKSDIVILPYPNDKERLVKSSNRIIDSLNLGRFVIMSYAKQFEEFKDYTYFGNISDGLMWLNSNFNEAINKIEKGQKHVNNKYSLSEVSSLWQKIINIGLK